MTGWQDRESPGAWAAEVQRSPRGNPHLPPGLPKQDRLPGVPPAIWAADSERHSARVHGRQERLRENGGYNCLCRSANGDECSYNRWTYVVVPLSKVLRYSNVVKGSNSLLKFATSYTVFTVRRCASVVGLYAVVMYLPVCRCVTRQSCGSSPWMLPSTYTALRYRKIRVSPKIRVLLYGTHTHPFNGPFSGTTRVSR